MHRKFLILFVLITFCFSSSVRAQSTAQIKDINVDYVFGAFITFKARVETNVSITEASVLFSVAGEEISRAAPAQIIENNQLAARFDIPANVLRPFAKIDYTFQVKLQDGQTITSDLQSFTYSDNRFPWLGKEDNIIKTYWYNGDDEFGQTAFDLAHVGLGRVSSLITLRDAGPISIFIYAAPADLQSALPSSQPVWAVGHASPDLGVIMISISPGLEARAELERQIPHELAHIILYRALGANYERLPLWLNEGIASQMETFPNPDYPRALSLAVQNQTLIPLNELCASFPPDASRVFTAYAQASSFVEYLQNKYGTSGLNKLITAYADGLSCEEGMQRALGASLSSVESNWRREILGEDKLGAAVINLAPYVVLLFLVLLIPVWRITSTMKIPRAEETFIKK